MNPTNESIGRAFREHVGSESELQRLYPTLCEKARELDHQAPGGEAKWPDHVMLRDTKLHDDQGGLGQRIFTTAGAGYEKVKYVRADLAAAPQPPAQEQGEGLEFFTAPEGLHPETLNLIARFAGALATKLAEAERKYGWDTHWQSPAWMDQCREQLVDHVAKGDPRDVAAYCAFLWHHGESTALTRAAGAEDVDTESASFKEGMELGRSESDFLCGMIENPQCQTCGARNAKEAETMCLPSGDGCPGTGWPLEKLWSLQAGADDARDAERYRWIAANCEVETIHKLAKVEWWYRPDKPLCEKLSVRVDAAIASQAQEGES